MKSTRIAAIFAAALLGLAAPAATASWGSQGEVEPNTIFDTAGYMYQTAPTAPGQIYFNAYAGNTLAVDANANNGITGSRVSPTPLLYYEAILGVWADCNGDGYIGLADNAILEYRSELLLDPAACPAETSAHNDGQWVTELITLGMVDPCTKESEANRYDPDHKCYDTLAYKPHPGVTYLDNVNIWGDQGAPGEVLGGSSCPIRPAPRGTFSNTGLLLRYADCFVAFRIAQTITDNGEAAGLAFDDPKNPQQDTDHPLIVNTPVSVFGNPHDGSGRTGLAEQSTGKPTATVWDCNDEIAPGVPAVGPSVAADPTDASAFDAADDAIDGAAGDCNANTKSELAALYYDQNLYGQDPSFAGLIEGNNNPGNTGGGKFENDFTFTFIDRRVSLGSGEPEVDEDVDGVLDQVQAVERGLLGPRTPEDLGISATHGSFGALWAADTVYVSTPQSVSRTTLQPSGRSYWSIYAQVDRVELGGHNLALPSPADFVYGADNCAGAVTGVVNGWNCNAADWWLDPAGASSRSVYKDGTPRGSVPGDLYQLRDVDCYDGTLVDGVFVRASATDLSGNGPCPSSAPLPV